MPSGGERAAVQNPFLRYAQEADWAYLSLEQALDLRRGITSPLLDAVLVEQLQRLNPGVVDAQRAELLSDRLACDGDRWWIIVEELLHLKVPNHGKLSKIYLEMP